MYDNSDARIHVDAWGRVRGVATFLSNPVAAYSSAAMEIDKFTWENKVNTHLKHTTQVLSVLKHTHK